MSVAIGIVASAATHAKVVFVGADMSHITKKLVEILSQAQSATVDRMCEVAEKVEVPDSTEITLGFVVGRSALIDALRTEAKNIKGKI